VSGRYKETPGRGLVVASGEFVIKRTENYSPLKIWDKRRGFAVEKAESEDVGKLRSLCLFHRKVFKKEEGHEL